ncbi:MAG: hypothetical protein QXE33_03450, partial [Candidatus Micrarchaeaceae archaeon]
SFISSTIGNNILTYNYSVYIGNQLAKNATISSNAINISFSRNSIPVSEQSKIVFEAKGNANYSSVDPTVYYTPANASLVLTSSATLASNLVCGNLTIDSGVTLTTDGYAILCNGTITNNGNINAGNPGNGGVFPSGAGVSYPKSYGGSGGGGAGNGGPGGSGSTPAAPSINNSVVVTWYNDGFIGNLSGAGGGSAPWADGGSGSYGIYIQANKIIAGTINAAGLAGATNSSGSKNAGNAGGSTRVSGGTGGPALGGKPNTEGGGGGGGGVIVLNYGTGGYTAGTYSYSGGAGGSGTHTGGNGGSGNVVTNSYGTSPPILVLPLYTTFKETGLPNSGESWSVTYNSIAQNAIVPNSIVFFTYPGNYLFTVANQVVSGTTYVPSPSSGYLVAGNTTSITFSPVTFVCTISLTPNAINFGSLNANANIATVNAITDSNTGNVNAYMLVYGGNWIGPSQFGVSNTTWSALSGTSFATANHLTALAANTAILVPASGSNTIYFGLGVPGGAPAGSYTQTITIENSC